MDWLDTEVHRKYHEVCSLFPLLTGEEFDALVTDIAGNGLLESIWLHPDDSIIDGRNRHRACIETEVEPHFRIWDGRGSLVALIISLNLQRRHLTSSQRATVAVEMLPMLEAEAKEKEHTRKTTFQKFEKSNMEPVHATQQAAEIAQTNRQYVSDAKKLKQEAPDLFEQVKSGEIKIPQAKRELRDRNRQPPPPLPLGKFSVIYADPPWQYDFALDSKDAIENQYPTMPIEDICNLPVQGIAHKDCILFLWATSPKLREALRVVDAWGFTYKTCMVWDKDWIGPGYYARQQHEILLIATQGHPGVPLPADRPPSVYTERRTQHSKKPDEFYDIIERMYPEHARVELFGRQKRDGWTAWGDEV